MPREAFRKRQIARGAGLSKATIEGPAKTLQLCARCKKIDLSILDHPERIKTCLGVSVVHLGTPKTWYPASCKICRLLRLLMLQSTAEGVTEQLEDWAYCLYAYSSKRSYEPGYIPIVKPKGNPQTILGIIPVHEITDTSRRSLRYERRYKYKPSSTGFIARGNSAVGPGFRLNVAPTIDMSVVKRWFHICTDLHDNHGHSRLTASKNPEQLRLINCRTRSIVPANPNDEYVALSYVWGGKKEPCGSSTNTLPTEASAVIEDAIAVVLSLELQFLWVDRYCIRQDDNEDKHSQISIMDMIYRGASLTVIAAAGNGPEYGLPGVRHRPREPPVDVGGLSLLAIPGDPGRQVKISTWMTRGWVYQEAILSQRRLIFTDQQVYFECEAMNCRETVDTNPEVNQSKVERQWVPRQESIFPSIGKIPNDIKKHISDYSKRKLSYDSDILNGILGIFRAYHTIFDSFHHFFGVPLIERGYYKQERLPNLGDWTLRLLDGFIWVSENPSSRRPDFPTWSWCGWKGSTKWIDDWTLCPDPSVTVQVRVSHSSSWKMVDFESIAESGTSWGSPLHGIASSLYMNARIIQLRFEYLSDGPSIQRTIGSAFHNGPGFYTKINHEKPPTPSFAPLYLDMEPGPEGELQSRLLTETWDCVVIGSDRLRTKGPHDVALICEWTGDIARRIGLVTLSRSISGGDYVQNVDRSIDPIARGRQSFWLE